MHARQRYEELSRKTTLTPEEQWEFEHLSFYEGNFDANTPYLFDGLIADSEHAFVWICKSCAKKHALETSDACSGGNICHVKGCQNKTSLVHYVWDYRPEEIEYRKYKQSQGKRRSFWQWLFGR